MWGGTAPGTSICWPKSSCAAKDLSEHESAMCCCCQEAKGIPGCTRQGITSTSRKVFVLYSALVKVHLEYCAQFCPPSIKETWTYGRESGGGTTKMIKGLKHLSYDVLRELGLVSLKKRRLKGISSLCINTWREDAKKTEPDSFQWCPVPRQEGRDR